MSSSRNLIDITGTITIDRSSSSVFGYLADLRNDRYWRDEINQTTAAGPLPQLGATAVEDSRLSGRVPHHLLTLACVELHDQHKVVYETVAGSPFYLRSTREVEAAGAAGTRVIYRIQFDKAVVKHGIGINLPGFLVRFVTRSAMKKYLRQLRAVLEKNNR